ncbi:MAG: acetylglutamate kinase [Stygiobacter sp.]|uniref:Acetylglutamate kinase n=1 Tax=Stygiobacter electus TaxID=3032292 RepID=A0AAE3TDY5_9BACT|nr:acetylglutamate kinase [Stygiobacter electus]MDF1611912.1 acetylglutamate kinase [Stygiobacter electus]
MTNPIFRKEEVLVEALPFIQQFEGKTFVVKYGGAIMTDENLKSMIAQDVTLLRKIGINVVVVHGGGKEITSLADKLEIESKFVDGQRYTDENMRDVVQMVLAGLINKDIVRRINIHGGRAVGISGIDANLITVKNVNEELGLVGEVTDVNSSFINNLIQNGYLPVIAPIGVDENGTIHNVNADLAAGPIAASINAEKLVYITDTDGVQVNNERISHLTESESQKLINENIITGGMIPKVESALAAIDAGVQKVHIINGKVEHALLLEIFTKEGVGTEIVNE